MLKILVPLLLLLPSVCGQVGGLRAAKFKHYSYSGYKRTWAEAQVFCRRNHTDLVTIRNEEENRAFVSVAGWIGLYREDSNSPWKWSRGGEIANFITWVSGEPDSGDRCGFKDPNTAKWQSGPCEDKHSFLCFDKKLVLVKEKRTWETALKYCRNMGALDTSNPVSDYQNHRYDLATLITQDDHDFARETAREAVTGEVWTGLRFLAGGWMWVGGEKVTYQGIKGCPTTKLCGTLAKNSTRPFGRRDCKEKLNFLCYRKY